MDLRTKLIRLAQMKPELREYILPLLKKEAAPPHGMKGVPEVFDLKFMTLLRPFSTALEKELEKRILAASGQDLFRYNKKEIIFIINKHLNAAAVEIEKKYNILHPSQRKSGAASYNKWGEPSWPFDENGNRIR